MEWNRRRGATGRARELRRHATNAEQKLWVLLRRMRLAKFRRQHPVESFIVDFVCLDAKLIVEVDGGHHAANVRDAGRSRRLEALGFEVLRFWNNDVLGNPEGVMVRISEALSRLREREEPAKREGEGRPRSGRSAAPPRGAGRPSPRPSPASGRGGGEGG